MNEHRNAQRPRRTRTGAQRNATRIQCESVPKRRAPEVTAEPEGGSSRSLEVIWTGSRSFGVLQHLIQHAATRNALSETVIAHSTRIRTRKRTCVRHRHAQPRTIILGRERDLCIKSPHKTVRLLIPPKDGAKNPSQRANLDASASQLRRKLRRKRGCAGSSGHSAGVNAHEVGGGNGAAPPLLGDAERFIRH